MKARLFGGILLGLLSIASGAEADVQIPSPGPATVEPPAIQQMPPPGNAMIYGGAPFPFLPPFVQPLPDPGALARSARRNAECMRLLKENRVFCSGEGAVPLRRGHD